MRILCVHGQGASPQIMETQLGSLIALLPSIWKYDYLEAPRPSEPGPGLKDVYPGPNFCFFDRYTPEAMLEATEFVSEVIEEDGPYDAIIGFSQGASVAASYLASHSTTHSFKFAVFICAALIPPSAATADELARTIGSFGPIHLPTCHIVGQRDSCYEQSMQLAKTCEESMSTVVVHSGGHEIPRDADSCRRMVSGIEKVARVAFGGY